MTPRSHKDDDRLQEPTERKRPSLWTKIVAWTAAVVAVLIVLAIVTVAAVEHSARVQRYLLAYVNRKTSASIGSKVELQRFALHLSKLSVNLYGLTVYGADWRPNPPLLQVDHIAVSVRVVSILHRKWYLNGIRVDHPVVRVFSDAHGMSNIPEAKGEGSGNVNLFELSVRHAVLDRGEVYFNDKKQVLEADLHDVGFRSEFNPSRQRYSGSLQYRDGSLRAGSFRPVRHNLAARFDATPAAFHLSQATISSGSSHIALTAALEDYSNPKIQAHYDALVDAREMNRILNASPAPAGVIRASGSIEYQKKPGSAAIDSVTIDGKLSSRQFDVSARNVRTEIRDIAAQYSFANGNATVRDIHADLLGGELRAALSVSDLGGDSHSTLNASLRGVSLADLKRFAPASAMARDLELSGPLNADAKATWGKMLRDLVVRGNATVHARLSRAGRESASASAPPNVIPVDGVLHGAYRAAGNELALTQSSFKMPETSLTMNGAVSNRSSLALQFKSNDLREVEAVVDLIGGSMPAQARQPLGLAGNAAFRGIVRGSIADPRLTGQLTASALRVKETAWRMLRANIDISPSFARFQNADLEPVSRGRITFNANAGLKHWSLQKTSAFNIELRTSQLDLATLTKVTGSAAPATGTVAANIALHGTELSPMGQGSVVLTRASVYNQPIQTASLMFAGTGEEIHGDLTVNFASGTIKSVLAIRPRQQTYIAQLAANGIRLDKIQILLAHNLDVKGILNLKGNGQGTFRDPQFTATAETSQLEVQKQAITALSLQMNVTNHVANASFNTKVLNSPVRAEARVNLTGEYLAQASLDTASIPLQPVMAIYVPSEAGGFSGNTEVHVTLRGPLKNWKLLEAHVTIPTLKVAYNNTIQLAAAAPVHLNYVNGVVSLERTGIRGTDTNLQIEGSIPVAGKAPMSLLLLGTVDLRLAQLFNPDIRSSGELRLNINSHALGLKPNVEGQVEIVNASFANDNLPVGLQKGNGTLTLTSDRLDITNFQAMVGGGTVTARGGIAYRPSIRFDLGAAAKGIRMLYPQGVRESLDADLTLAGSQNAAILGGQVRISDLSFTPSFDFTNFAGQLSSGVVLPPAQGFSQRLTLNLAVNSINNLNLTSRTLSINGTANLEVRGTAAEPVILGRVNLSGGDAIFNGDRFIIEGGTVEFANPAETQPVLNVSLNTTIQQYNVHLRFNGPLDQLRTNYTSDPSLPAADIINLLAFGQTAEANAANPATPGNQAAESLVASQVSGQITSRVSKIAGISQLSINPVLAGNSNQGPAGANVTIQQRVTGNFFVTFSTNVASTQNQIIMGQYQLSPRVAVTGTRDQNGGFAFDTIFKNSW